MTSSSHVAVVTGDARGIGRRVALTLAERGYRIAANDLDTPEEALEELEWVVAFLADPEQSGFVNGHTPSVDGGWCGDGGWESIRRRKQGLER